MESKEEIKTCPQCNIFNNEMSLNAIFKTCNNCGWHYRMEPFERIKYLTDEGSFDEFSSNIHSLNPLNFPCYEEKLSLAEVKTGMKEAILTGTCAINGRHVILCLMSFNFMGGSMGSVVGEKLTRAFLKGAKEKIPIIIFTASGGARMQEGIFSLLQMAKTSSAAAEISKAGVPYFIVLCDPTTGGVTASFAMLADIIMAEPSALIGFAGPRVIKDTIKQNLPTGFQKAEFQLKKGFVDIIVPRKNQKKIISTLIDIYTTKTC